MKSTNQCLVVPIQLNPHPNADTLSVVKVWEYTVCVRTEDWKGKTKGIYIPPDSIVDTNRLEFSFLKRTPEDKTIVIRAKKLRGTNSFGLLIPATDDSVIGEDWAERLGVTHYEPEMEYANMGDSIKAPISLSKYDIDTVRKYKYLFVQSELVWLMEKCHGHNQRMTMVDDTIYVGSRSQWKKESDSCLFWQCMRNTNGLEQLVKDNPNLVIYGEGVGKVKGFNYGLTKPEVRVFDIFDKTTQTYWNWSDSVTLFNKYEVPTVPVLGLMPFDFDRIESYTNGISMVPNASHIKEGLVIRPKEERYSDEIGRVILKLVGSDYLEKKK